MCSSLIRVRVILRFRFQLINEVCDCFVSSIRVTRIIGFEGDASFSFLLLWSRRNRNNRLHTAMKKKEEKEMAVVEEEDIESQTSESEGWSDEWNKITNRARIVG